MVQQILNQSLLTFLNMENTMTMKRRKTTKNVTMMLAITALAAFAITPSAFATDYHSGNIWSSSTHTEELSSGKVPMAFMTSELSSNLVLETGTTINDIYTGMGNAIIDLDTLTDAYIKRKDTTTFYHDNEVGTADLVSGTIAKAYPSEHWWPFGDNHLTRVAIDLNHDDYDWDNGDDDSATSTINVYTLMMHELGHVLGLCDTYSGGNTSWDDCHGYTTTDSMMDSYDYGETTVLSNKDKTELNREY